MALTGLVGAYGNGRKRGGVSSAGPALPWYRHCSTTCLVETGILAVHAMRRLISFSVVILLSATTMAHAQERGKSREQIEFGIKVAQLGLWNEALYRWQKATELDPTYAAAWNNLAIAYEHEGKFDEAKKAYEKALQIEPKNLMIRQNYDLFKEINDRTKRRAGK